MVAIDSATLEEGFNSLDESEYDIAKKIINRLLQDIRNDRKLYNAVEICFIKNGKTKKLIFVGTMNAFSME